MPPGVSSDSREAASLDAGEARALNAEGGAAPDWIELIPPGPEVKGRDGRGWTMRDPQAVVAATRACNMHLPIDTEHAGEIRAPQGLDAPAAGWIEDLEVRGGAIWGRVDWTPAGGARVANREYRFISPVFDHTRDGEIVRLCSAGLTNNPNLRLTALNRAGRDQPGDPQTSTSEDGLNPKAIREALGLAEDASDDQVIAAAMEARALNRAGGSTPDLTRYVPMEQYQRAANRVRELEQSESERGQQARDAAIDSAIEAAQLAGKIVPASAPEYRAMCREEGGLERFQNLVATLPVIASPNPSSAERKPDAAAATTLSEEERAVCRALGQSEEDFLKARG